MSDFDLARHISSRGQTRDGGRSDIGAERWQLLGGSRRMGGDRHGEQRCRQDECRRLEREAFHYETVIMLRSANVGAQISDISLASRSDARNFFEVILPHGSKTACIARTWV
jgi:hypothetical protein